MTADLLIDLFSMAIGYWWIILIGTTIGIIIGAIPGFGAHNTIIILLPLTLAVPIDQGLTFMVSLYVASHMGSGIPAILLNIPGTGGAAATTLDGYPMAQKGLGQQALVLSFLASTIGGFITAIIALFAIPYLAQIAFYLHSVEMVVVMLFGITLIAVIAAKDTLKGLIAGLIGLLIGGIGADHIYSNPRGTFGFLELYDGVPLVPALIGLFALSEAFVMIEQDLIVSKSGRAHMLKSRWSDTWEGIRMGVARLWHVCWTSLIGLGIGAIPGAGASIASFVAYQQSRTFSKTPDAYGKGHPEGVLAPEAANNGVSSGSLIPMLVIGVPGGSTAAVMMVVLNYHGVALGPRLFTEQPVLAYGVFVTMIVSYVLMIFTILPLTRYLSRITLVPTQFLAPSIICFTLIGAFIYRGYPFDMGLAIAFGVIGYIARKTGFHVVALLIGVILGPLLEENFLRALRLSGGDLGVFFSRPIANGLWLALLASLATPWILARYHKSRETAGGKP
ncbi:tripartite tricarboxylate transporter permease [Lutibaculum baratangense]|uniref:Tricarboxylate transport membrane protein TctA n=1 Tax=Lutibaculum baratangense AMV1 TaxID=631454 RepID=V4QSC7_9HYPH|nr:tripartite tricarboxylate transporter permease [Lutibaculum baratangense]ESR22682.1 Tricarboxylate transport membrane protein TctA [Lutibaculum baratangense AMV1]